MKKFLCALTLFFSSQLFSQSGFEGIISVLLKNEKGIETKTEIKVRGENVFINQTENGNKKYDHFVLNLATRDFYTVSTEEKKIVIKYQLDSLLNFYSRNNIKEDFTLNLGYNFKLTDKGYVAENNLRKVTLFVSESNAPINALIPLLRLIGSWNEADGSFKNQIMQTDVFNKVSKKKSEVNVSVKPETMNKEVFELPKGYLQKDFAELMKNNAGSKDLKTIVQTFAEF